MKRAFGASLITLAVYATIVIAGDVKSGPQPGKGVSSFFPLNISNVDTPAKNGKESCFVWQLGGKPVALVFARETNDAVAGLARKLEAEVAKAGKGKLNAVVIFTSDEDDMKDKIEKFKTDNKLKNVHLGLDGSKGPEGYNLSKDASVTALLYVKRKVQINHAFEKFAVSDIDAVIKDFSKLNAAPEKK